jgi:hypothetical protein
MGVVADLGPLEDQGPRDLGPYPTDADVLPADPVRFAPFLATAHAAFGPLQDDAPAPWTTCYAGPASCAAAPCALLSTCCVATGDCAELQLDDQLPGALLFTSCASGASALTCLAGQPLTPLGSSTPTVEAGGMRPGGDATQEGGVLVGQPVDLRVDRVELSVVFVPPVACSGNGCLESAGVSLARAEELSLGVVNPLVGLLYSPSRGDVSLVVGGLVRASWLLPDPNVTFTLELHPSGMVRVHRDEELLSSAFTYSPRAGAQVVLHGRNSELQGARVRSLHALQYRSEAPSVFGARTAITLSAPVDVDPWQPHDPTVVEHEGRTYVVVENDRALYRGELVGTTVTFDSAHRVVVDTGREDALLTPSLLVRPGGETFLVYTAELEDGTRVIRARRGVDGPLGALPDQLAVASVLGGGSLDDPSVIEHGGRVLMMVRHRAVSGETELELWRSPADTVSNLRDLTPAPASNLGTLTQVSAGAAPRCCCARPTSACAAAPIACTWSGAPAPAASSRCWWATSCAPSARWARRWARARGRWTPSAWGHPARCRPRVGWRRSTTWDATGSASGCSSRSAMGCWTLRRCATSDPPRGAWVKNLCPTNGEEGGHRGSGTITAKRGALSWGFPGGQSRHLKKICVHQGWGGLGGCQVFRVSMVHLRVT